MEEITIGVVNTSNHCQLLKECMFFINQLNMKHGKHVRPLSINDVERKQRKTYNSCFCLYSQAICDTKCCKVVSCKVSSRSIDNICWTHWWSIQQNLEKLLQFIRKLNGPGCRIELIMNMFLLPFIFSIQATISFLLYFKLFYPKETSYTSWQ